MIDQKLLKEFENLQIISIHEILYRHKRWLSFRVKENKMQEKVSSVNYDLYQTEKKYKRTLNICHII